MPRISGMRLPVKQRPISQQQIARDLGVSQALVSLVLNGKRENISEEVCDRIWKYAVKMGYRPKGMQMDMNHLSTPNVGFILRAGLRLHTQSNFFSSVQHGMHVGLLEQGYYTFLLGSEDDLRGRELNQKLKRLRLFGIAIFGQVDEVFLKAVKAVQPNVVTISAAYPGLCHSVMSNEPQALGLLMEHLYGLGHRQFGWIGGDKHLQYSHRRRTAFQQELSARGLKVPDRWLVEVDAGDRLDGWSAAEILVGNMTKKNFPTAWVCANGMVARGAINYLTQNGWRIPEQISVVAVDATRVCTEEFPTITGAHTEPEKMGVKAAELLSHAASPKHDGTFLDVVISASLTVRQTTGKAP
jgi:LacI family transcriptional regulator